MPGTNKIQPWKAAASLEVDNNPEWRFKNVNTAKATDDNLSNSMGASVSKPMDRKAHATDVKK